MEPAFDIEEYFRSLSEDTEGINIDGKNCSHIICRLIKSRSIKIIEIDRHEAMLKYKCKRKVSNNINNSVFKKEIEKSKAINTDSSKV
jgi:hypothetical protein